MTQFQCIIIIITNVFGISGLPSPSHLRFSSTVIHGEWCYVDKTRTHTNHLFLISAYKFRFETPYNLHRWRWIRCAKRFPVWRILSNDEQKNDFHFISSYWCTLHSWYYMPFCVFWFEKHTTNEIVLFSKNAKYILHRLASRQKRMFFIGIYCTPGKYAQHTTRNNSKSR